MFIFQTYADKKDSEGDHEENKRFGMKVGKSVDFLAAAMAMPDEQFAGALVSIDKAFKARGISDFMGTLTPGAQNAIYASSFVWGYENAAKYVQNAMKLDEVKNAANEAERSKIVVESVQQQALACDQIAPWMSGKEIKKGITCGSCREKIKNNPLYRIKPI